MTGEPSRSGIPGIAILMCFLVCLCAAAAGGGEMLRFPGLVYPQPRQLGLDDIDALPEHETTCPVCGYAVLVPEIDKLIYGYDPGGAGETAPVWQMHAESVDSDLCPHPGKGKVAFQADVVVCPSCGYAAKAKEFGQPLDPELRQWVVETLKPGIQALQIRLLGERGRQMSEEERIAFFNHQNEVPDLIRLEHARSILAAKRAAKLARAETAWRAAWSCRRTLNSLPSGQFLAAKGAGAVPKLEKRLKPQDSVKEKIAALIALQGKTRSGKMRLTPVERIYASLLLAGAYDRRGFHDQALDELTRFLDQSRERYAKPERDPLYAATAGVVAKKDRPRYLENARLEIEQEIASRIAILASEQEYLGEAADFLKEALLDNEITDPDLALFFGYLISDLQRRRGELALAMEWFKAVAALAAQGSALQQAATDLMETTAVQAGDSVNLLSAIGHDGVYIEKLREICKNKR